MDILKQILFNLILFLIELVILTSRLLTAEGKLYFSLTGILIFWIGNLYLMHQEDRRKLPEQLHTISEFCYALKQWGKQSDPFRGEIRTAIQQLEAFHQKQRTLLAFDSSFRNISEETEAYLLSNMKKILRRMLILNPYDNSMLHRMYLCNILEQNQKVLYQYDQFLGEVFQMDSPELPCLETVTEALREVRKIS